MVMQFVQRNRRFFQIYCGIASFLGRVFLGFGAVWAAIYSVAVVTRLGQWDEFYRQIDRMPRGISLFILCGVLTMGVGQFLRYLIDDDAEPGRLLRIGDKLLYVYAGYAIIDAAFGLRHYHFELTYNVFIDLLMASLIVATEVFIVVGLAQLLKRSLPMIEESKSLV